MHGKQSNGRNVKDTSHTHCFTVSNLIKFQVCFGNIHSPQNGINSMVSLTVYSHCLTAFLLLQYTVVYRDFGDTSIISKMLIIPVSAIVGIAQ